MGESEQLVAGRNISVGSFDPVQCFVIGLCCAVFFGASVLSGIFGMEYTYSRVADELSYNASMTSDSPCLQGNGSDNQTTILNELQRQTSVWGLRQTLTLAIPAIFANICYGTLTDSWGRKPLIIVSTVGSLTQSAITLATVYWKLPLFVLVIANAFDGIGGSMFTFNTALFTLVADITRPGNQRTVCMVVVHMLSGTMSVIIVLASGYVISNVGFLAVAISLPSMYLFCLIIEIGLIKETLVNRNYQTSIQEHLKSIGTFYLHIPRDKLFVFIVCTSTFFLHGVCSLGDSGVQILFILNEPFCFDTRMVGWYNADKLFIPELGSLILIKLFHLFMGDELVVVLSFLSKLGSAILISLATSNLEIFLVPLVGVASTLPFSVIRGILSRITSPDDQGAMFGGLGAIETLSFTVSGLFLNLIYQHTVDDFPGTVFLCVAAVELSLALVFMIVVCKKPAAPVGNYTEDISSNT